MAGKKFKQRKTDVIQDGVVYRLCEDRFEEEYSVYTYTEDLPEKVVIADRIHDIPVTIIGTKCFYRSQLREAVLPDTIKMVGSESFAGCKNLENLSIPDSVTYVWCDAFERCKKLNHTLYSYGQYLGNPKNPYLILHKNAVIEEPAEGQQVVVEIHPETKFILSGAFNRFIDESIPFADIDQLIIHDKLISVGSGAFSLSFSFGFNVKKIGLVCVDRLEALCRTGSHIPSLARRLIVGGQEIGDTLTIPATITEITVNSFIDCNWMKKLRFEGNIDAIKMQAFRGCKNLVEVQFPPKVGTVDMCAFLDCPSLRKVEFFEVEEIDSSAFELERMVFPSLSEEPKAKGLEEIIFHARVGVLCSRAFSNNADLQTVIGMENVETIEGDPFTGTPFENKFV